MLHLTIENYFFIEKFKNIWVLHFSLNLLYFLGSLFLIFISFSFFSLKKRF
ncbi:hypothetical protein HMPREF0202_02787 [Cetobacterium somerae ATCC BAA-474]|uniref:Uncharacterized protein n=1 Tax=Cetobacterium somerae ATCC BAA-474 TaxID=1319815 RepID=U7V215_9FUSO|nr:hypothetical protein HMPREF0202_02787 [Cetobacterium somerae ATCC BAA-474]